MTVLDTIGGVLGKVPASMWVAVGGVVASVVTGCWQHHEGAVAARQHVADSVWTVARKVAVTDTVRLRDTVEKRDTVWRHDTVGLGITADSGAKLAEIAENATAQVASLFAVLGHKTATRADTVRAGAAIGQLVKACTALAANDTTLAHEARTADTQCAANMRARDSLTTALAKLDSLDAHKPAPVMVTPRLVFGVGAGYDLSWVTAQTFTGRPFATLDATARLPLGFQAVVAISGEPHVARPTDIAAYLHHDFAHLP